MVPVGEERRSIADDGVGLNVKTDPRSTGMGQRIVTAMASKLEASVERDPARENCANR